MNSPAIIDVRFLVLALAGLSVFILAINYIFERRFWTPLTFIVIIQLLGNWIGSLLISLKLILPGPYWQSQPQFLALRFVLFSLAAVSIGYWFGEAFAYHARMHSSRMNWRKISVLQPHVLEILYFILILLVFAVIGLSYVGLRFSRWSGAFHGVAGFNFLTILGLRGPCIAFAIILRYALGQKRIWILCFVFIVELFLASLTGDRDTIFFFFGALVIGSLYFARNPIAASLKLLGMTIILSVVNILIHAAGGQSGISIDDRIQVGLNRLFSYSSLEIFFENLTAVSSEYVQSWFCDLWEMPGSREALEWGRTYLYSIVNVFWIRPLQGEMIYWQASVIFKSIAYPKLSSTGYEFACTSEAMLNFGPWGGLFVFLMIGFIFGYLYRKYLYTKNLNFLLFWAFLLLLYLRYVRTDSTTILRLLSMIAFAYIVLRWLFRERLINAVSERPAYEVVEETIGVDVDSEPSR